MMPSGRWLALLGALLALALSAGPGARPAAAAVEIQWWHAMDGALEEWVKDLAAGFNTTQQEYKVNAVYKGNYTEVMTSAIAAFRAKQQPHIVQVFEVGTATMMAAKGAVKPVYELMAEAGEKFDPKAYLPAVTGYYTTADGRMLSLPLNSSTPVLYYNKDAFRKAGLDPAKPPRTWPEMGQYGKKIQAAGYPCGFSSQWQQWILLENYSAWHNVPFASKQNGFGGLDTELLFNSPLHVRLIDQLAQWQKTKTFDYGGRKGDANPKFSTGECGMFLASSAHYANVVKASKDKFEFGITMMPYWPDVPGAPQNSIIGGGHAVGARRPQVGRLPGGGQVLQLPLVAGGPGGVAPADRLPPHHHGGVRADEAAGLLRQAPGDGHLDPPDEQQAAHRQLQGAAPRELRPDPRRDGRGAGSGLGRQEDGEGGAGRGRQARERAPAPVRAHEPLAVA
jgi:sn-glycerol 3-phosphate transport system substrate-binding protein